MTTVDERPGPDDGGTTQQPAAASLPARVNPWVTLIGGMVATIAVVWAGVKILIPIGTVDVTVRVDQEVQVNLPAGARDALHLSHDGRSITHASIISVEVVNSGSQRIGSLDQPWDLNIRSIDGSAIVPLGTPAITPSSRPVMVTSGKVPDIAVIRLSLFNRGDRVRQDLMLIEPKSGSQLPIVAEANVPDLQLYTGRRDVRGRLFEAFTPPAFVVAFVGLGALMLRDRRRLQRLGQPLADVFTFPTALFVVIMGAAISAGVLVWILALIAERVLAR